MNIYTYSYQVTPGDIAALEVNLGRYLSADEVARVQRIKHRCTFEVSVLARALLRRVLAEHLSVAPHSLLFEYSEHGKPELVGYPQVGFNVSHSAEQVVIGVSSVPLGVDIERVVPRRNEHDLAAHVMHGQEWLRYQRCSEASRTKFFFQTWVLKEAFCKWDGRGIQVGLQKVQTQLDPPRILTETSPTQAFFLTAPEGFCAALVAGEKVDASTAISAQRHVAAELVQRVLPSVFDV